MWSSVVRTHRLWNSGSLAAARGLSCRTPCGLPSRIRGRTGVPCFARWTPSPWTAREALSRFLLRTVKGFGVWWLFSPQLLKFNFTSVEIHYFRQANRLGSNEDKNSTDKGQQRGLPWQSGACFCASAAVWSLVEELRSRMPCVMAPPRKRQQKLRVWQAKRPALVLPPLPSVIWPGLRSEPRWPPYKSPGD